MDQQLALGFSFLLGLAFGVLLVASATRMAYAMGVGRDKTTLEALVETPKAQAIQIGQPALDADVGPPHSLARFALIDWEDAFDHLLDKVATSGRCCNLRLPPQADLCTVCGHTPSCPNFSMRGCPGPL